MMGKKILVIGDSHAHPDHNNDRFDWLGNMIADQRPDIIVDIGDFADMPSLSQWDVGKLKFEGRRYLLDIEVAKDARRRVMAPTLALQAKTERSHRDRYHPRWVAIEGNHEDHINRAVQQDAKLDGLMSHDDLGCEAMGWEFVPFGTVFDIEGILFTHHFIGGVMGKPIGGLYPTVSILRKYHCSCVQGHAHYFQMRHEKARKGNIWAFIAGCYFDYDPDWTKAHVFYDRGILVLNGVHDGDIESFAWTGIEEIKRTYR